MISTAWLRPSAGLWRSRLFGYQRNVYLLLLFTLGKGFQISIAAVTNNLYFYSLGYHKDFIGLLAALPAIGSLAGGVPAGLLADRFGRKPLLVASGLLNPLALAAIAFSPNPGFQVAAGLTNGVLSSAYWVINLPALTESTRDDQRVGVLALNSFLLLGVGALGGLLGGAVPEIAGHILGVSPASAVPLRVGVLAAAVIVFLPALPLIGLRELPRVGTTPEPAVPASSVAQPALGAPAVAGSEVAGEPDVTDPVGRRAVVALFVKLLLPDVLMTTGEGTVIGLLVIYLALRFHVHPGTIGALYTVAGLTGGATSLLAPRLVRRWGTLRTATTMQFLSIPAMLTIGFAPIFPLAAAGEFTRATLRGLEEPVYAAFAMQSVSRRLRATLSGFYSTTWSIGFTLGPTLAGLLQQHVGLAAPFPIGAACVGSAATLLVIFFGRSARAGTPPSAR
jgi:MFS family permease